MRLRVGLTGGIGSGKSEAGRVFGRCGALVVDADALAREALAPGSGGLAEIARRWPEAVRDGALDRPALAALVFADPEVRAAVNGIVHPFVRARGEDLERMATIHQMIVHEIPLLFETGSEARFDATVLVTAPEDVRIARVRARSGLADDETRRRMAAQIDPGIARTRATFVVENDGSLEAFDAALRSVYARLEALAPRS